MMKFYPQGDDNRSIMGVTGLLGGDLALGFVVLFKRSQGTGSLQHHVKTQEKVLPTSQAAGSQRTQNLLGLRCCTPQFPEL